MLKEVRDDNRENDAEHMKPVSRDLNLRWLLPELNMPRIGR